MNHYKTLESKALRRTFSPKMRKGGLGPPLGLRPIGVENTKAEEDLLVVEGWNIIKETFRSTKEYKYTWIFHTKLYERSESH